MAYFGIVKLQVALVLTSSVFSFGDQQNSQLSSSKKSLTQDIEVANKVNDVVSKNTDWNDASERITNGLKVYYRTFTDWYNGTDACSKTSYTAIQNAITRGAAKYVSCVKIASNESLSRQNQLTIKSDAVHSNTTSSVLQVAIDCLSSVLTLNVFRLLQGCSQDVQGAIKFMSDTSNEVKGDTKSALNDSIKVAKCADDTMSEAAKMASTTLLLFNVCRNKLGRSSNGQNNTTTTKPTAQPTVTTEPITPNTPSTKPPTIKANFSGIVQSAVDRFNKFDDRIAHLRQMINDALQLTQTNYGTIIETDVIMISDSVVNAGRNARQRIETVRARFKTNETVLACYNTSSVKLVQLVSEENTKTQRCFSNQSAIIALQVGNAINLDNDFNTQQVENGAARIAECANNASQLSNELVTQCVTQILENIDDYLTDATIATQKLLDESKDMVDMSMKCVQDGFTTVRTGAQAILDNFKNCTEINV